ncbi:MAG: alanine racemase [Candidatus Cloacimonetes bacterium]|nr:alanine racemase [Candidatus Cloacimonadota bacterium]
MRFKLHSYRSFIEISAANLVHNFRQIASRLHKDTILAPVVKANAYGHGLNLVVEALKSQTDWFCVDSALEAFEVLSIAPEANVLVMGMLMPTEMTALPESVRLGVYSLEALEVLAKRGYPARIHLKLETGLNRLGIQPQDLNQILQYIKNHPSLILEGVYTHYANVEDTLDSTMLEKQNQSFETMLSQTGSIELVHTCASAAAILHPDKTRQIARIGISLYGYTSSWQTQLSLRERGISLSLRPAIGFYTRIAQIKTVKAGDTVGYGCTHRFLRPGQIAVLPVGYYDGMDRGLSSSAEVIIAGKRAPIVGRIAMNMCMAEVTHIPHLKPLDRVILLGGEGQEMVSADEWASKCLTINYEILSRLPTHIPRFMM